MYETLRIEQRDKIAVLYFNRPDKLNALNRQVYVELGRYLESIESGEAIADVLVLTGEGTDFTIGRDRKEPKSGAPYDAFRYINAVNQAIAAFPGIIIASVRGRAHGLGVGLTMRSDIAIAADDA